MQEMLKAKHKKSFYKSTDAWLEALWRNNEERIRTAFDGVAKPKAAFKSSIKVYMKQGLSPAKAIKTLVRSTLFTPARERFADNAKKGLLGDEAAYKAFQNFLREKGKFGKYDPSKMVWNKEEKVYVYDGRIIISFKESPKRVIVRKVRKKLSYTAKKKGVTKAKKKRKKKGKKKGKKK